MVCVLFASSLNGVKGIQIIDFIELDDASKFFKCHYMCKKLFSSH